MSLVATPPAVAPERISRQYPRFQTLLHPTARSWSALFVLLAWCSFLFFYGLNTGEFYRTESLRAIIAAEFLRSGNWIVPTLYGEPLLTKPPGMYAAIALASWPFGGVCEWTARLPSALAATVTVLLFYWYFARQLGRRGGLTAALILPMSYLWLDKAIAAEIDMLQVAWVTAALLFFLRGLEVVEDNGWKLEDGGWTIPDKLKSILHPRSSLWLWWPAALLCVAGGVLTKWTAPVFFYGAVVPLLWWRGRLRLLLGRQHLVSAALGAAVCFAWAGAAVGLAGWDAFYETVSREALQRLSPSHHLEAMRQMSPGHHHLYPWAEVLVHPWKLLGMNLPWSVLAVLSLWPGFARQWDERGRRLLQAMHCWVWPNVVFWSIIPEHATRHSLPLFPGIAGLAAMVWVYWLRAGSFVWPHALPSRDGERVGQASRLTCRRGMTVGFTPQRVLIGLVALWLVAKLLFVHVLIPQRNPTRQPQAKGELLAAHVPRGETLYLFRLKDEGIMFYYGQRHGVNGGPAVRRLPSPAHLPAGAGYVYCVLDESEWKNGLPMPSEVLLRSQDEQGAPIVLLRLNPARGAGRMPAPRPAADSY
jgi:4-amino-4-deoxy-L-arabinose transferase-like glycosyltransferase